MTSVEQLLARARELGVERLDAQLLLAHRLGVSRAWLIAHDDADVPDPKAAEADLARRAEGVPLAYLVGRREFHGLELRVTPDVLDPRPDTETLVDWALEHLPRHASVIDLGTGSGAIALAIKHARPDVRMHATDMSDAALAVARQNSRRLGLDVTFTPGDWWEAVPDQRFDMVVSNPPYIAGGDPHLAALRHEPSLALTPGGDGLGAIRSIVAGAPARMGPGAWLMFEHGFDQAEAVRALLVSHGFTDVASRADLAGHLRCSAGRRPG